MLKVIIVDDEQPARDELKYLLSQYDDIEIVGECDNGETAIACCARLKPQVAFLDIQMRGISGIETARILRQAAPDTLIVFATAYDEYALHAFDVHAVDYLLKPFEEDRLADTVERLKKQTKQERSDKLASLDKTLPAFPSQSLHKLVVEKEGRITLVNMDDIIYIHIANGIVRVITTTGTYIYHDTLAALQTRLSGTLIQRVHRSYLVNLSKVQEILPWYKSTYWLKVPLPGKKELGEIPVSKSQIKTIKEILGI